MALGLAFVLRVAEGQTEIQSSGQLSAVDLESKAESALDHVQRNDMGVGVVDATHYIEWAAHVEPLRAIPVLEAFFSRTQDSDIRNETASVLVSIGDESPQFWNLILDLAQSAVSEDPPDPLEPGEATGESEICASKAFLSWAKSRNLTRDDACKKATIDIAEKLRPLVDSGDPRGVPVLRKALNARNRLIRATAARGVVLIGDRDSITLVIEAIEHAPQDEARALADSLIESDDPRAESMVHQYMPDVNYREAHQFRAQGARWRRPILKGK